MAGLLPQLSHIVYSYLDFLWVPITLLVVHKNQRWKSLIFVLTCLLTMRTQVELMESIGHSTGIMSLMNSSLMSRGMITYSIIIMLFLILAYYSPKTENIIFFTAMLSIYILAVCLSMILMVL